MHILDLMTLCWSRDPFERPSANQIVAFASSPEFCALHSAIELEDGLQTNCACSVGRPLQDLTDLQGGERRVLICVGGWWRWVL